MKIATLIRASLAALLVIGSSACAFTPNKSAEDIYYIPPAAPSLSAAPSGILD